jgi:hypothetical protein
MDKKLIGSIVIIIIAIVVGWYVLSLPPGVSEAPEQQGENGVSEQERATLRGVITSVDTTQAMVDGPYLVNISSDSGEEATIAVPSMGILLCEAKDNIVDIAQLQEGLIVEVSGTLDESMRVVPCASSNDYLRIIQ